MDTPVNRAITTFKEGGIVIYPTDTAFGIGCRLDCNNAVDRLFSLRKRPANQPTPVLVSSIAMATEYFDTIDEHVDELMHKFWPGAVTIVSTCKKEKIYAKVRGGSDTIGLRMPNHTDVLEIIASLGVPILGPSANFHQEATPYVFEELSKELISLVDYVLVGECSVKQASTVVSSIHGETRIIRQGAVIVT
jgi:L-threonylcarbamoyladenylate synthase